MTLCNEHIPTDASRQRVRDLAVAGIPKYLIAEIIDISPNTLDKYYKRELNLSEAEMVEKIAKIVAIQAIEGNEKSQALYLKTKAAKYGWIEKQVIETQDTEETKELKDKVAELEAQHKKEF